MRGGVSLLLLLGLSAAAPALAGSITYTATGVGSGNLDGTNFTNAAFTISTTADTTAIRQLSPGVFLNTALTSSVSVAGIGSDRFTFAPTIVSNENFSVGGFSDLFTNEAIFFVSNPAFATYNLSTAFGPVAGTPSYNAGSDFSTTRGNFTIFSASSGTFQASPAPAVPEASTTVGLGLLLALGMGGLVVTAKRKKAASTL